MSKFRFLVGRFVPNFLQGTLRSWSRRNRSNALWSRLKKEFPNHKVRGLDIGARYGVTKDSIFRRLADDFPTLELVGIEPDEVEAKRLLTGESGPYVECIPVAVGATAKDATLFITRHPGCSSVREPDSSIAAPYLCRDFFDVIDTCSVSLKPLDEVLATKQPFDIVKLDVQGFEDEVILGGTRTIGSAVGVYLEAQLQPLYHGQTLFTGIHERMSKMGFRLIHLSCSSEIYNGEILEVDCAYIRALPSEPTKSEIINRLLFALLFENLQYCQLILEQAGSKVLGELTTKRLAMAGGIMDTRIETPKHWLPA